MFNSFAIIMYDHNSQKKTIKQINRTEILLIIREEPPVELRTQEKAFDNVGKLETRQQTMNIGIFQVEQTYIVSAKISWKRRQSLT